MVKYEVILRIWLCCDINVSSVIDMHNVVDDIWLRLRHHWLLLLVPSFLFKTQEETSLLISAEAPQKLPLFRSQASCLASPFVWRVIKVDRGMRSRRGSPRSSVPFRPSSGKRSTNSGRRGGSPGFRKASATWRMSASIDPGRAR